MANAIEITQSDIKDFKRCRQLWDYRSTLRQGLAPKWSGVHFKFGELFHRSLEQYYLGDTEPWHFFSKHAQEMLAEAAEAPVYHFDSLLEQMAMGPYLLKAYKDWAEAHDDFTVIDTEQRLTLRINDKTPGIFFGFRYDMLIERDGRYWLMDFKTSRSMPSELDEEIMQFDEQSMAYQWAAEQVLGKPIAGFMYTYIWKRMPTEPEILKSGGLTRRKNLVTTADMYYDTVVKHGLDVAKYRETIARLRDSYDGKFFKRFYLRADQRQRERYAEVMKTVVNQMIDPNVEIYPYVSSTNCRICDFRNPCFARQAGFSDKTILETEYEPAEPRE